MDAIDPDGTLPTDELNQDRRFLHLRPTRDGAWTGEFRLTGVAGAKLKALLDPLATPRVCPPGQPSRWREGSAFVTSGPLHDIWTPGITGNGCTTPSKTCVTGCSAPATPSRPVGCPPPSSSPSTFDDLLNRCGYGRSSDGTLHPHRHRAADGQPGRHHPRRVERIRCRAGPGPQPADRVTHSNPGIDRPRRRLHLPRLRPRTPMVRTPPHRRMG